MKTETLQGLLMDRELGELPPDVVELLEAYLAADPAARHEADAVSRTVRLARETVRQLPGPVGTGEENGTVPARAARSGHRWLALAAALAVAAGVAVWIGNRAGQTGAPERAEQIRHPGLWAQYSVAYDARRGVSVVRENP
jgi:anti-sigma factor RsiW